MLLVHEPYLGLDRIVNLLNTTEFFFYDVNCILIKYLTLINTQAQTKEPQTIQVKRGKIMDKHFNKEDI